MATITKIDVKTSTYQGKEKKSILFTLDDGTSGYPSNKDADKAFREGDIVTYSKETKTSGQGKTYNVLTLSLAGSAQPMASTAKPEQPTPSAPRPSTAVIGKSVKELKVDAAISAMEFAFEAYCAGKIGPPEIEKTQRDAVAILWREIDEIFA